MNIPNREAPTSTWSVAKASDRRQGSVIVARAGRADLALPRAAGGIDAVAILQDGRILAADARQRLRVYAPTA